jgi:hypothetical protein
VGEAKAALLAVAARVLVMAPLVLLLVEMQQVLEVVVAVGAVAQYAAAATAKPAW